MLEAQGHQNACLGRPNGPLEHTLGPQDRQNGTLEVPLRSLLAPKMFKLEPFGAPSGNQNWYFGADWEHLKPDIAISTNFNSFGGHCGSFFEPEWTLKLQTIVSNSDMRNTCNALRFLNMFRTILWRIVCLHRSSGPLVRSVNTDVSLRSAMAVQSDALLEMHVSSLRNWCGFLEK